MTLEEIKKSVFREEKYGFLHDIPLIFLTLGGSWAYGTNTPQSDVDLRGIMFEPVESILGLSNFEQMEKHDSEKDIDCVIYGLRKMCHLLLGNNPNCIEILSPQEDNWLYASPVSQALIDNRHLFLSKKSAFTFGAYAKSQLDRMENAMCHDSMPQVKQEEHMLHSIEGMMSHFNERFCEFEEGAIQLKIVDSKNETLEKEIVLDINLKNYPLRDYKGIWSEMQNVVKDYSKLNGRNRKKDIPHLCKHMMHLVRLYLMGIDILEKEEIITRRENDIDLLMAIRNGEFMSESGLATQDFYKLVTDLKIRFDKAVERTKLPEKPNFGAVEKLVMGFYKKELLF